MSEQVVVVYVGQNSASNMKIGLDAQIWGFSEDLMARSNYLAEFANIEVGDPLFIGHAGPSPRVPSGGWNGDDTHLRAGTLGVISDITSSGTATVWPDGLYPYRVRFEDVQTYTNFNHEQVGVEIMEALRLSANQQGRPVLVQVAAPSPGGPAPALPAALNIEGELEQVVTVKQRKEQNKLRAAKLNGAEAAPCVLCGRELPVRHLRAAHIKKRSECSNEEKLNLDNVMLACVECDALFELGDISVDDTGIITTGKSTTTTDDLDTSVNSLIGKICTAFSTASAPFFAHRRAAHAV